jgi:hypothetical protein
VPDESEIQKGRFNMKRKYIGLLAIIGIAAILFGPSPAFAQISLGTAQGFAVLGGQTVTNAGPSVITGDVGVSPGAAIVGIPPGLIVLPGVKHAADGVAAQAQLDLTTAYGAVAATACTVNLTGQDLGGLTLKTGVYCFDTSAFLTGQLTLDFEGNPNAVFLFKTGTTVITAVGSSVLLINTGTIPAMTCPPNVYWQVGSSATLEVGSTFIGNILALQSISMKTGAKLNGRALARNASVTLDTTTVTACAPAIICPFITVNPPALPNAVVGDTYDQTVSASAAPPPDALPYKFAVTSGALPNGLSLNPDTGRITGPPLTTAGTFNFTITATDANGCPGSRPYSIVIAPLAVPPCPPIVPITLSPLSPLPAGVVGKPYSQTITASGGTPPYAFVVSGLPTWLSHNETANTVTITGTAPTTPGLFSFTITATDANLCPFTGAGAYSFAIACPVITLSPATLPFAVADTPYTHSVSASGGAAPYAYAVSRGTLPTGLSLDSGTGAITGTPTVVGDYSFTIRATDKNGCQGALPYAVSVVLAQGLSAPTLDFVGLTILMVLLAGAGLFVLKRF